MNDLKDLDLILYHQNYDNDDNFVMTNLVNAKMRYEGKSMMGTKSTFSAIKDLKDEQMPGAEESWYNDTQDNQIEEEKSTYKNQTQQNPQVSKIVKNRNPFSSWGLQSETAF